MATKLIENKETSILVEFNNGDLKAIKGIKEKWKFKDMESALRFGLAILTISEKGKLYHEKENGIKEKFEPARDLIENP